MNATDFMTSHLRHTLLTSEPKIITRYEMISHFKDIGHFPVDISRDKAVSIVCPIYADNAVRPDVLFNNYICTCGRLYIFKAIYQKDIATKAVVVNQEYTKGVCPCDTCRYFKEGCKINDE